MNKKIFFTFFFYIVFCLNSFANEKIVFIDANYIFKNSSAGKKFTSLLEKKLGNLNADISKYRNEKEASEKKLISQKNIISDDEYEKKFSLLKKDVEKFNKIISKQQEEIKKLRNKAGNNYANELKIILENYSKENSILIVLKKENILIGKKETDITKKVLEIFDKKVSSFTK